MTTKHVGLTVAAIVLAIAPSAAAKPWPAAARSTAADVARHWADEVAPTARLGAEPAGRCRRVDDRRASCPIAIVVVANGSDGRKPWRCSATVVVTRAGDGLAGRRRGTRCAPFPPPPAVPDAVAAIGTAYALNANGDVTCLPANDGRLTCVMSYVAPPAGRCAGAASVPVGRPERSVALGAPLCRQA